MRVPRRFNPDTNVANQQLGYAKASTVDYSGIGQALTGIGEQVLARKNGQDAFELDSRLLQEANELEIDFDTRKKAHPLGDQTFAAQVNASQLERHQALLQEYQDRNVNPELLQKAELRLSGYRDNYVVRGLEFQNSGYRQKVKTDVGKRLKQGSQYVSSNPRALLNIVEDFERGIYNIPDITAAEADELVQKGRKELAVSAALAEARLNPEHVIQALDPKQFNVMNSEAPTIPVEDVLRLMIPITMHSESRGNPNAVSPKGARGLMQVMPGTSVDPGYGVKPSNGTPEDDVRMGEAYLAAMMAKYGNDPAKAWAAYNAGPGALDKALKKSKDNWLAHLPSETRDYVTKNIDMLQKQAVSHRSSEVAFGGALPSDVKTGIQALDELDGPDRQVILQRAYSTMAARNEQVRAEQRRVDAEEKAAHDARVNDLYNGLLDGSKNQVDIDAAYKAGWLTDYDERNKAQGIVDEKSKKNEDLELYSKMYSVGGQFNPYDQDAVKAVEAGFEAAVEHAAENGIKTTPLHIGENIWRKTGIVPTQLGTMLRGGLVSTNPATAGLAASIATNMLAKNPNVFAGMTGGEEVSEAAANYQHLVENLGFTAQEASTRLAEMNKPEARKALPENSPERQAFQTALLGSKTASGVNITTVLNKALGLDRSVFNVFAPNDPTFASENLKVEAKQTYAELALQHFDKYKDGAAAEAYATKQMTRFYGMNHGKLMKFPPNKAYPAIGGSQDYILEQAQGDLKEATGKTIPLSDIWLEPIPRVTSNAFRNGGKVPYALHYFTEVNGYRVYETVRNKTFTADVGLAKQALAAKEKAIQQTIRQNKAAVEAGRGLNVLTPGGF